MQKQAFSFSFGPDSSPGRQCILPALMFAQLAASIERVFRSLDADCNGFLDRDELRAGFAAMVRSK
jgi:hypothetical protein